MKQTTTKLIKRSIEQETLKQETVESSMSDKQVNQSRRVVLGGTVLGMGAVSTWSTPAIKAIVTPTHAMMSPVCPDIVVDDIVTGPTSGQNGGDCQLTFDIFSGDASVPINIVAIDPASGDLAAGGSVEYELGEATMSEGVRVVWIGSTDDPLFCSESANPINDITFTITAECETIPDFQYSEEIALSELYELAEFGNPV